MRPITVLLVLLAGCGSSSAIIDSEIIACAEAGNEVSVALSGVNVESPASTVTTLPEPSVTIDVEVSNNTHVDIVVKRIALLPKDDGLPRSGSRFRMNPAFGKFEQVIAEGKDHVFTLRTTGRWQRSINDLPGEGPRGSVEVETRVELENGQTYRCFFELPVG